MSLLGQLIFALKVTLNVTDTQSVATDLVCVGRTYALACCANLAVSLQSLIGSIQPSMCRHNQMGFP